MDRETRGLISEIVNDVFEKQSCLKTLNWVLEADDRVRSQEDLARSQEDLALGYFLGSLMNTADHVATVKKLNEKLEKQDKKRLKKIYGKEAAKELKERGRRLEEMRAKGGRPIKAELTEEEKEDIKKMLIPMIALFREKIRMEITLSRI